MINNIYVRYNLPVIKINEINKNLRIISVYNKVYILIDIINYRYKTDICLNQT